jgi:serine/threonine protein kinase
MNNASTDSAELPEGTSLLDRYTIIDRVAGGGMATIYRATDERLDRVVCVKLLRLVVEGSGSTSGGEVYQATYSHFLREALALSRLAHPNTLRIYDFGYFDRAASMPLPRVTARAPENGRPFQISEFLDGGNLEQFVRARGPLGIAESLSILERMAGAAAEAHQLDIIHRDIKPSNILFARVGAVLMPKLADFGIARCDLRKRPREGEAEDTLEVVSTIPLFSPRWAAPEQLAEAEEGPSTDVYALGLVTTFMLAGTPLFDHEDVRSTFTERVRGDDFVARRLDALAFPAPARDVLVEAMRADPKKRTASPLAFHAELSRALRTPGAAPEAESTTDLRGPPPDDRRSHESITIEAVADEDRPAQSVSPPERWVEVGGRRARVVEIHEKLDLSVSSGAAVTRFRVTFLPARQGFRLHLKGLNCFVGMPGTPPSPALVADSDGAAFFASMTRDRTFGITWSFGEPKGGARAFRVGDSELLVTSEQAAQSLALELGPPREIIVICRRG